MKIVGIHHVTLAVRDLNAAAATFARVFGARADHVGRIPAFGVRTLDLDLGDSTFQLAAPEDRDNPLARFVERKGEGFYNLAIEVEGLDDALRELQQAGIRVSEPVDSGPGLRSAFIAMASTHGLSIQLVERSPRSDSAPRPRADAAQPASQSAANAWPTRPRSASPTSAETTATADRSPDLLDLTPDEWSDTD